MMNDIKSMSYADRYGTSILMFCVLMIVLFVAISYFRLSGEFQPIRDDWVNRRCEPGVIPLAGIINAPEDEGILEYTSKNFTYCVNTMLKPVADKAVSPFDMLMNGILKIFNRIKDAVESIRKMLRSIRGNLATIVRNIYNRLVNIIIPIQDLLIRAKDLFGKANAVMQTSTNMIISLLMIIKSFLGYIVSAAANILVTMALVMALQVAIIAGCWFFCPWLLPGAIYVLAFYTAIYVVVIVLLCIIIVFVKNVTGSTARVTMFNAPSCFDENTQLELADGTTRDIAHICVGDTLKDGGVVTAKMKLAASSEKIYILRNVIVSGTHRIKHNGRWIFVSEHPEANRLFDYDKPYLYCVNTTTKKIVINDCVFMDWDEVDESVLTRIKSHTPMCDDEKARDIIRMHGNGGIQEDVWIAMHGRQPAVRIKDVHVGDTLKNAIEVYGIVETRADMVLDKHNIYPCPEKDDAMRFSKKIYHLLTRPRYFFVDGVKFMDYNNYIDSVC